MNSAENEKFDLAARLSRVQPEKREEVLRYFHMTLTIQDLVFVLRHSESIKEPLKDTAEFLEASLPIKNIEKKRKQ